MNVRHLRDHPWTPAIVAGSLVSLVTFALWHPVPVGSVQDDGLYVILGKSLAQLRDYRFINLPDAPRAVHYPPGYPALIAVLWALWPHFPQNAYLFGVANIVLLGAAAVAAVVLARRLGIPTLAACVAVLAGFLMPPMLALSATLMSEPLWLALAIPWLIWAERQVAAPRVTFGTAALGLGAAVLMLVRTQSLALLAGVVIVLLWRRKWAGAAIVVACAFVVLLPWQRWVAHYAELIPAQLSGKYGAYNAWVAEGVRSRGLRIFADAIAHNAGIAFRVIRGMFSLPGIPGGAVLFTIVLLPPVVAGAIRLARQAPVLLAALCLHAALILVFPYDAQRYVWGSWPFITIWLAAGFVEIESRTRALPSGTSGGTRRYDAIRIAAGACVALVIVSALATTLISVALGSFRNIAAFGARQLTPMVAWAGANAPADAVIASDDETAVYLYTGRRAVPLSVPLASWHLRTDSASPVALEEIMRRYQPTLVMARWTASVNAALRLTEGPAPVLVPVAQLQNGFVFARVRRDSTR